MWLSSNKDDFPKNSYQRQKEYSAGFENLQN